MKFSATPAFKGDWARLSEGERAAFRAVVRQDFHPACERRLADPSASWPGKLRVRSVANAPGIDGRATFEWIQVEGEPAIRWRRIGGHAIFGEP